MRVPLTVWPSLAALLACGCLLAAGCGENNECSTPDSAQGASPVADAPAPPALSQLTARNSSALPPEPELWINPALPAREASGKQLTGGDVQLGDTTVLTGADGHPAWAVYALQGWRGDKLARLELELAGSTGTAYVGVSNYLRGSWHWQAAEPVQSGATRVEFTVNEISALQTDGAGYLALLADAGAELRFDGAACLFAPSPPVSATGGVLGVPVQTFVSKGVYALPRNETFQQIYTVCNDPSGPTFVMELDPESGLGTTYPTPDSDHIVYSTALGTDGQLYYCNIPGGAWFSFNPATKQFASLGTPIEGAWVFAMAAGEDGRIWGGNYETMELVSYTPSSGQFSTVLDPIGTENTYPRAMLAWQDKLLIGVGPEHPGLYVYNTYDGGTPFNIWPEELRTAGGWVEPIAMDRERNLPLIRYTPQDGAEELMRYFVLDQQLNLTEITDPYWAHDWMSDGRQVWLWDHKNVLEFVPTGGHNYFVDIFADRSSANIYSLHNGPDGLIYGGTFPLHLFQIDPISDAMADMGNATGVTGQIYAFDHFGTRMYMASYPRGNLSVHDTAQPYVLDEITHMAGRENGCNPRDLGNIENFQNRPLDVMAAPDGRVYIGSLADYGHDTGALTVYDPETQEFTIHELYPGEAITGLTLDSEGELWGASWYKLFHWDQAAQAVDFEIAPVEHTYGTNTRLALDRNGYILGMYDRTPGYLYAFDPRAREIVNVHTFQEMGRAQSQSFTSLAAGPDGLIYGFTFDDQTRTPPAAHFWVVDPDTFEPRTIWLDTTGDLLKSGLAFYEDSVYIGAGSRVVKIDLAR